MAVASDSRVNRPQKAGNKMTPEIYFARKLASNEKKIRDKSLKKLRRWIAARSAVPDGKSCLLRQCRMTFKYEINLFKYELQLSAKKSF